MVREKTKNSRKKGFDLCSFDLSAEQACPVTEVFMACHISYLPLSGVAFEHLFSVIPTLVCSLKGRIMPIVFILSADPNAVWICSERVISQELKRQQWLVVMLNWNSWCGFTLL